LKKRKLREALDEVFMDRHLGIPIFLSFMWMMFTFTYSVAQPLQEFLESGFDFLASYISGFDGWFFSMLGDGVIAGVGNVLSFVPNIAFLFLSFPSSSSAVIYPEQFFLLTVLCPDSACTGDQ